MSMHRAAGNTGTEARVRTPKAGLINPSLALKSGVHRNVSSAGLPRTSQADASAAAVPLTVAHVQFSPGAGVSWPRCFQRLVRCHADLDGFGGFGSKAKGAGKGTKNCPCGSGRHYSECCQLFHKSSSLHPDTPEKLCRARYAAFVKKAAKYIKNSSHPDNPALKGSSTAPDAEVQRHCSFEEDLAVTFVSLEFSKLEILGSNIAQDGNSAAVDLCVYYKRCIDETGKRVGKPAERMLRERAVCVKDEDGRWLLLNSQPLQDGATPADRVVNGANGT